MVKALDAPYEAGRRGASWLKVKRAHTLDLVVLAAEWGHGRRRGWLSNLHLGARDPSAGGFVMLGKTFKGMTDEMLRWQTGRFLELEVSRDEYTVFVRPVGGRGRVRRPAGQPALSGRTGPTVRSDQGLPARQGSPRRGHDRDGKGDPRPRRRIPLILSSGLQLAFRIASIRSHLPILERPAMPFRLATS